MALATTANMQAVLSAVGYISRGDDTGDGLISSTEETNWVTFCQGQADDEIYKRLLRRYTATIIQSSSMAVRFAAIIASANFCRHRGDPIPESLMDWYDEVMLELDDIRAGKLDLAVNDDLAPERAAALPILINQGFDPRFARPLRRQTQQSSRRRTTKPYGIDYRDRISPFH